VARCPSDRSIGSRIRGSRVLLAATILNAWLGVWILAARVTAPPRAQRGE
jgi:hypothetical protein